MSSAAQENAMMLASLLGIGEEQAAEQLSRTILLTVEPGWRNDWSAELFAVLNRTVTVVREAGPAECDVEIVIGTVEPRSTSSRIFVALDARQVSIAAAPMTVDGADQPHSLYGTAAACIVSAAAVHAALSGIDLPGAALPTTLRFSGLGVPPGALDRPLELVDAYVAGAGAVAHGFLHAARHLDLRGTLTIVDPKTVQPGILNRCLYLGEADIGQDKATVLARNAQADFPTLTLAHAVADLREVVKDLGRPPETVFVTVDSRSVRRSIQKEFPHRTIDASTTDVSEVIVHSNTLPTDAACLACIYRHVHEENSREQAIAAGLGIDLDTLQRKLIDEEAARMIVSRHPDAGIDPQSIIGIAFDSLFRRLCGQVAMTTPEGRQVLAPFAFVSAWAGVLMAVEMLRSFANAAPTNFWRINPWGVPLARTRTRRPKAEDCEFCSNPAVDRIIHDTLGWS